MSLQELLWPFKSFLDSELPPLEPFETEATSKLLHSSSIQAEHILESTIVDKVTVQENDSDAPSIKRQNSVVFDPVCGIIPREVADVWKKEAQVRNSRSDQSHQHRSIPGVRFSKAAKSKEVDAVES